MDKNNSKYKELWLGVRTANTYDECQQSGIYIIKNLKNGQVYVGSTTNSFQIRWSAHSYDLRNNKHHNCFIQDVWNRNNDNLVFEILEAIDKNKSQKYFFKREQYYIDNLNSTIPNGYNICDEAGNPYTGFRVRVNKKNKYQTSRSVSKQYTRLNDKANQVIFYNLNDSGQFTRGEIDTILKEGMPAILEAYGELLGEENISGMFDYCMKNLDKERIVSFKYRENNSIRNTCTFCAYHDSNNDLGDKYDYCHYYDKYLPPIDIDYCHHCKQTYNKDKNTLVMLFGKSNIDDVIEDYLNGRDYSTKRGDE